jgi:hypothetical protein
MLPILLILLLGAIDFGRLYFSWVGLHQAARIGANHASVNTTTTDVPAAIADELDTLNCESGTPSLAYTDNGTATSNPQLGDYARVTLTCDFSLLTPLAGFFFGDPIPMTAISSFPVRTGCLGCGSGSGSTPPPPPPEQCRTIPQLDGLSVQGARLAWASAGFTGAFTPSSGQDYETVAPGGATVTPVDPACTAGLTIFTAEVMVATLPVEGSPPGPDGCEVLPNVMGLSIEDARTAWSDSNFTGTFLPLPPDDDPDAVVETQLASQSGEPITAEPGVTCLDLATDIEVEVGEAWPPPPVAPCQVPHLIDKSRSQGHTEWYLQGFAANTFSPTTGNFTIKSQSLVGFTWVPCGSSIVVAASGGGQ